MLSIAVLLCAALLALALPPHAPADADAVAPSPRVSNGTPASIADLPAIVLMSIEQPDFQGGCTGTVIAPRWVLTAAHCFGSTTPTGVRALIGRDRMDQFTHEDVYEATRIIVHPNWRFGDLYHRIGDVALVELDRATTVTPQELAATGSADPVGHQAVVAGWGETSHDVTTEVLRRGESRVVDDQSCQSNYGPAIYRLAEHLCAERSPNTTCRGDSGGPLLIAVDGRLVQYAVTSYGPDEPCGTSTLPAAYSAIGHFRPWIESHVTLPAPGTTPDPTPTPTPDPTPSPDPDPTPSPDPTPPDPTPDPPPSTTIEQLRRACVGGSMSACDELFRRSPTDSDDQRYGDTCANRQPESTGRWCVDSFANPLALSCANGDLGACDRLFATAPPGSWDRLIGESCGFRISTGPGGNCVATYGPSAPGPTPPGTFWDVPPDATHAPGIAAVAAAGITTGYHDNSFRPGQAVSRAQMASFLVRAEDRLTVSLAAPPFVDVPADDVHAGAIAAVAAADITGGVSPGRYAPTQPVTRGQMASFLVRTAGWLQPVAGPPPYRDVPGDHVHAASIAAVAQAGVAQGFGDGTFRPGEAVTRGQMATFLARTFLWSQAVG